MYKQLKDYLVMDDIVGNNNKCVTHYLGQATYPEDANAVLIEILTTNIDDLTVDYLGNRLDKVLSPLYQRLIDYYNDNIVNANNDLYLIAIHKYFENWNRIANALFSDYNPISNYDMKEHEDNAVNSKVVTTTKDNITDNKLAGFNSDDDNLATTQKSENNSEVTSEGSDEDNTSSRDLTRSGNIGVTTSQQMIESELELRKKNIYEIIYSDLDKLLFLDYYIN